jgi:hypothetical protein
MATVVKCDNPKCSAHYEVSSFLGGHTFTCNRCGSRVTIRDLSYSSAPSSLPPSSKVTARDIIIAVIIALAFFGLALWFNLK